MNLTGVALETLGVAFKSNSYSKDDGVFLDEFGGVGKLAGLHDRGGAVAVGSGSEDLNTTVLPAAMARPNFHTAIISE